MLREVTLGKWLQLCRAAEFSEKRRKCNVRQSLGPRLTRSSEIESQNGVEKFRQFVFKKSFVIKSDHKPLEWIMKWPLADTPPRLQRVLRKLQKHDCVLEYRKDTEMIADALTRTFIPGSEEDEEGQDIAICRVVYLPMFSASLYDLEKETWADVELCLKADGESQRRLVRQTSSYRSRYPAILALQG